MNTIADVIDLRSWQGYRGDFGSDGEDANRETYYTVWRGIEVKPPNSDFLKFISGDVPRCSMADSRTTQKTHW